MMTVMKFLRRHWGKLLILAVVAYIWLPVDNIEEGLGLTSGRMARIEKVCLLAPFPEHLSQLDVRSDSGIFHYVVTIYFRAPPEEIEAWLQSSPSIAGARVEQVPYPLPDLKSEAGEGYWPLTQYHVNPGVVEVSANKNEVGIVLGSYIDSPAGLTPLDYQSWLYRTHRQY